MWHKVEDGVLPGLKPGRCVSADVLATDGDRIVVVHRHQRTETYWQYVDDDTQKRVTETHFEWCTDHEGNDWIDVKYWMELPGLPPKPPEDPEKVRERQLLGLEEKLEHEDYLAENPSAKG